MRSFGKLMRSMLVAGSLLFPAVDLCAMNQEVSEIEKKAWSARELSNQVGNTEGRVAYDRAFTDFVKSSREFAHQLVEENRWQEFSEFYKTLDAMGKQNFEFVVKAILEDVFRSEDYLSAQDTRAQEYFPGYGYAKPGYTYRRGKETKREFLYAYWKEEVIEEAAAMVKELTIEISLLAKFQLEFPKLEVLEKLSVNIEGKIYECVKIKIEKSKKVTTKQIRKFGYEKAWFELYEAKKVWWGEPAWQLVGETFQHDNTPTGESVVTSATL